jgi:hypothetical protein
VELGQLCMTLCTLLPTLANNASWTAGLDNWPYNGEIDIIEGVNEQCSNIETLHTGYSCMVDGEDQLNDQVSSSCDNFDINIGKQNISQGCSIDDTFWGSLGYGPDFNEVNGGVCKYT